MMTIEGINVEDAEFDANLIVSDEHVRLGVPMDIEKCPGALACLDSIPAAIRAQMYKSRVFVLVKKWDGTIVWIRYVVTKPLMIQEAIIDNNGKFTPGVYLLRAPTKSKRTGRQQGSDTRPDQKPIRRSPHKTHMRVNAPTRGS
jgi:hypothetical protein